MRLLVPLSRISKCFNCHESSFTDICSAPKSVGKAQEILQHFGDHLHQNWKLSDDQAFGQFFVRKLSCPTVLNSLQMENNTIFCHATVRK